MKKKSVQRSIFLPKTKFDRQDNGRCYKSRPVVPNYLIILKLKNLMGSKKSAQSDILVLDPILLFIYLLILE